MSDHQVEERSTTVSQEGPDADAAEQRQQQHEMPEELPSVVTVSALDELQDTLRERNARIAFLEQELVDTRLQLASSKTLEDRLLLELNKMGLALAAATKKNSDQNDMAPPPQRRTSTPPVVSSDEGPHETHQPVKFSPPTNKHNGTVLMPLGQKISFPLDTANPRPAPPTLAVPSRKRSAREEAPEPHPLMLNPGSCASGLGLLAGDMPSGNSQMSFGTLDSASSINRMLGDIGLTFPDSTNSLKKRKSGDVAAGSSAHHRRSRTSATSSFTRQLQRNEGWGEGGGRAVPTRPTGNMFVNCLLSARPEAPRSPVRDPQP